jgi:hypothetical protein
MVQLHHPSVFSPIKKDFIVHQYRRQSQYAGMDCRDPLDTTNKLGSDPNYPNYPVLRNTATMLAAL